MMIRVCPLPEIWAKIFRELSKFSTINSNIPSPPIPLILAGWNFSDDFEKKNRWNDTVKWSIKFVGFELITHLTDADFYCVSKLVRPDFLDFEWGETSPPSIKPTDEDLDSLIIKIDLQWKIIAGVDYEFTKIINFSGAKARSLIVEYATDKLTSWGTWGNDPGGYRNQKFSNKQVFTLLRQRIN